MLSFGDVAQQSSINTFSKRSNIAILSLVNTSISQSVLQWPKPESHLSSTFRFKPLFPAIHFCPDWFALRQSLLFSPCQANDRHCYHQPAGPCKLPTYDTSIC